MDNLRNEATDNEVDIALLEKDYTPIQSEKV